MGLGQGPHWEQLPWGLRDARRPAACNCSPQLGWHPGRLTNTTSLKVCFIHFMRRDGLVPLPGAASACWGGDTHQLRPHGCKHLSRTMLPPSHITNQSLRSPDREDPT